MKSKPAHFLGFHDMQDGPPAALRPYLGETVNRAWILDGEFYVWLKESNDLLRFARAKTIGDIRALEFHVGQSKPGADFSDVADARREVHCDALMGMKLTGIVGAAVVFNGEFGAELLADRVRWVRDAKNVNL